VCTLVLLSLAISSEVLCEEETIRARVVFIGDIMVHSQQLDAARAGESWDFKPQFQRVRPLFWNSLVVGNLETVFGGEKNHFTGYPPFNTPDELAGALSDLGVDIAMLANNHILDKGLDEAARTTKVLDDAGIFWTGLASREDPDEPLVVEYGGLRWGFVNYAYGSNIKRRSSSSEDLLLNIISDKSVAAGLTRVRTYEPDITVAFFHWGQGYWYSPTKSQKDVAVLSLESGADIVIGTHPHVLQPVEVTSSDRGYSVVAYSLGNFVSFQRKKARERSAVLAVDVEKKPGERARLRRVSIAPIWVSARNQLGLNRIEVVYAGDGGPFNHAGLPIGELDAARTAGRSVLEFLGAAKEPDDKGFYALWDEASPDAVLKGTRRNPE
jgi:poly-gamma-glutamate synthesis protein (capsule biosynthesis protein)